jgi:lipopolysaccharide transport system permease protein
MLQTARNLIEYRELLWVLTWKAVVLRYKQAYFGILWAILKPVVLVLIFMLVRSIVGIDSGDIPYPLLTYCALLPWIFFQESASDGVGSVVNNATLIRKIYFPREIFPLAAVLTKTVELGINFLILIAMMAWYGFGLKASAAWVPLILLLTVLAALSIAFVGAAINVHYRDMGQFLPVALSLMMYASPVIYPLELVKNKLLVEQAAGEWSQALFTLYCLNPLAGIIDTFQRALLTGRGPDWVTLAPGMLLIAFALPISYWIFKNAEAYFADVV